MVDLMMGQTIQTGQHNRVKFLYGLSYVDLSFNSTTVYSGFDANPNQTKTVDADSSYIGIGPRIGLADRFRFTRNFGLIAEGSFAVFLGKLILKIPKQLRIMAQPPILTLLALSPKLLLQ